ncbi:HlyD family secretion protein [Puia sp. P3]|uniref:HlyD family secretion protein n=1 Tax=Puia sp. P3 TaxID=3423952 RepID=UPI003D678885
MTTRYLYPALATLLLASCSPGDRKFDAEGVFEADEVIVSSEVTGRLIQLTPEEGAHLAKDSIVAVIDSVPLKLQKQQIEATMGALRDKTMDPRPTVEWLQTQIAAQKIQLDDLLREKARTERLIAADAATTKQLDDYNTQIAVLTRQIEANHRQIRVQQTAIGTQNSSILSELKPLRRSVAAIDDQLSRTLVHNPVSGTVLTKYAMAGEITTPGKALYKIADLSLITLRIYLSNTQLSTLKLGQELTVFIDDGPVKYREYPGVVTMISDKAEFTPKTIQTKEERANLVYSVKVHVKNDGYLRIGMYAQVKFRS